MKKNGFMLLAGFALLLGLFLIPKTNTEAASKVSLSTGTTYTSYDVTGDGKTDSLRLAGGRYCGYGAYEYLYVYVNNQLAYTVYDSDGCIYKGNILTLNNGKQYLYLQGSGDSSYGPRY
ncbi:MAG: hypothetical protein LUF92_11160, partial [Clostridiales bacterium]|nr:hypothetical protein [Clostridiales bacterium]